MGGVLINFLFSSVIKTIILSILIIFIAFNFEKNFLNKKKFDINYECSFKTINTFKIEFNYSNLIMYVYMILYKLKMFLFVFLFFNVHLWVLSNIIVFFIYAIFSTIIISFKFDFKLLKWVL